MTFSDRLLDRLASARAVTVLTGAGISAESGIPTFRDAAGLWQQHRPEDLATPEGFRRDPALVQGWYAWRHHLVRAKAPNAGHYALAALEALVPDFTLVTQNVDGLHQRAGSRRVIELHGSLARFYCLDCGAGAPPPTGAPPPAVGAEEAPVPAGAVAHCAACGGLVRPDVVWFGEVLPAAALAAAHEAAARADVLLSVGTSGIVYPAAGLPLAARQAGAYTAEVNPLRSALADALDEVIEGPAGVVLPALVAAVEARRSSS